PAGSGLRSHLPSQSSYFLIWYTRSPLSLFGDSICRLCFLAAVDRKPRTLCASQPVVFRISARLAPWERPINPRIWTPLLSARGAAACLARAAWPAFGAFDFLFRAAWVLPPAAVFWRCGAPFVWLAPFFAEAWAGATGAAGAATLAAVSWISVWVILVLISFS